MADTAGARPERDTGGGFLQGIRRWWLLIAAVVIACVVVSAARQQSATENYEATASVSFGESSLSDSALQVTRGSGDPERDAATNVLIASSAEVAAGVREELDSPADPETLLSAISVEAAPNANVLYITAGTTDPTYSARLANAFAEQYIEFQTRSQVDSLDAAVRDLQTQIDQLPAGSSERANLVSSMQRLGSLRAVASGGAQVIGRASPPSAPSGMSLRTAVLLGLLVGLAVALSLVFLIEALDRRVRTIDGFERGYRLPALAAVPRSAFRSRRRARGGSDDALLEPYRILRSAIDVAAAARPIQSVLVTSAVANEGKTTVAADLAHAIALTGRQVTLVELDLRRPTLSQHFEVGASAGVTAALTDHDEVDELLVEPFDYLPNLTVLPAGPLPPNPSELLASKALVELLESLAVTGAMVILDAPPINAVADTQELLNNPAIDGAIVVARIDHTTRDQVRRARAILDRHALQPIGVVVTGVREESRYGYSGDAGANGASAGRPTGTRRWSASR
ncbi:MAG TPA: polysaccharide biosynthesis tyrosine autokinase [Conexibacter sp.]|nr:polysaccharide biosynthesis tyrosine autokinase [Conexibacter sp.]